MAFDAPKDLRTMFKSTFAERDQFLSLAEQVADLTLVKIDPRPGQTDKNRKHNNVIRKQPINDFGGSAVKGLTASLNQTLNPSGVRFYKLQTDPSLILNEKQQAELDSFFRREELRIAEWLNQNGFTAFSDRAIERNLIEGTNGVRVDPEEGLQLFKTRNIALNRRGNKVNWIVFEGFIDSPVPDADGVTETKSVFTMVNKRNGDIFVQGEDDKEPTQIAGSFVDEETGEIVEIDSEDNAKYWFVFGTEVPQFNNYAHSFYMDHLSLLIELEDSAVALKMAKKVAGSFFYVMNPTGIGDITPQRFSRIKNLEVVTMDPNKVTPWSSGIKLGEWEWLDRKYKEDGQRLLALSAVGIFTRRAGVKTATEIRAIRAELETLIGSTASVLASSFYFQIVEAAIEVLGVRKRLAEDPALEGIDKTLLDKLIQGLIVTGSPEVARERELEKMQAGAEHTIALFGDRAMEQFNIRGYMDTLFDNLGINTTNVLKPEEAVKAAQEEEAAAVAQQVPEGPPLPSAVPLPGPNGQLNQSRNNLQELRAGAVL